MGKKNLALFLFLLTVFILLSPKLGQSINLCRWQGYANKSGTLVNTTDFISIYNGTKTYNATIFSNGMYTADVQAESTDAHITFKICGVYVAQGGQAWSCPASDYNTLNLSISLLANGASCSYSCACSGGYCCSGASQYISGNGTGTCQASACTAPSGEAAPSAGAVTGGVVTVTEEGESTTFTIISASGTGFFNITKSEDFKIMQINITVVAQSNNVKITIKEGSLPSGATLPVAEGVGLIYKYLEITKGNITNANISIIKIKFKVAKTWINSNNISSNSIALQRYSAGAWTKLTTTKVGEDSKYYYYVTETDALSLFAITGEKVAEKVACPYECCVGEAEYIDKACLEGYECEVHACKAIVAPQCPTCQQPSDWSDCIEGERTRINYRCSSETNYECEEYTETEDCEVPPVGIPSGIIWGALGIIVVIIIVFVASVLRKKKRKTVPIIKI